MGIKFPKAAIAIIGGAIVIALILAFVISEVSLAQKRAIVTREIYAKAGLVMGDLYVVQFSSAAAPEVVTEILRLLVAAKAPTNQLMLVDCQLQAQAWHEIGCMQWLHHISLQGTNVTDSDLVQVTQLRNLRSVRLARTRITDVGIEKLTKLKELRELNVNGTEVSESQLLNLKEKLRMLDVNQTIFELRESRSQRIERDDRKHEPVASPLTI